MKKKALMACGNYWTSPFQVGSHHIAKSLLALGWEVAFISNPISPLHCLQGMSWELRERYAIYRGRCAHPPQLWPYVPGACFTPHAKPLLRTRWAHENWQRFSCPNIVREARAHGFGEVDLLYLDSPLQAFWLKSLVYKKSVLRVADHTLSFRSVAQAAFMQERKIARQVDVVVYAAEALASYVEEMQPKKKLRIANGVNFCHFAGQAGAMPEELQEIGRPIVLYVGAISDWFDYETLDAIAAMLPELAFVVIGPDDMARKRLRARENLYLLGRRSYERVPDYMHHAQVGIIPFNRRAYPELINGVNPLKMYEYLACGLPVVATRWDELEKLQSPARLCDTPEEFAAAIRAALREPAERRAERVAYAQRFDWREITAALLREIGI